MTVSLASLIAPETKATIYAKALEIATAVGLPVTSWHTGDPTRSDYHLLSEVLSTVEEIAAKYVSAGFLDLAALLPTTDWLVILADQVFGYTADAATYATCTVRLTNGGGGLYEIGVGEVTVKDSSSGKTYHNTTGGTLASGPATTLDLSFVADESGAESSSAVGSIDTMVTNLLEVTCANTTAAVGTDAETAASIVAGCRAKLAAMSPNGPRDAYNYVACSADLTGTTGITRARTYGDSATGQVTVYLAGPSGAISGADRTLAETAILAYATPVCITPTVASASNKTIAVTYEAWVYSTVGQTEAEIEAAISTALGTMFAARPIGGDLIPPASSGMNHSLIESTIRDTFPLHCFNVSVTLPAGDTTMTVGQVAVIGAVTATVNLVPVY